MFRKIWPMVEESVIMCVIALVFAVGTCAAGGIMVETAMNMANAHDNQGKSLIVANGQVYTQHANPASTAITVVMGIGGVGFIIGGIVFLICGLSCGNSAIGTYQREKWRMLAIRA